MYLCVSCICMHLGNAYVYDKMTAVPCLFDVNYFV